MAWTTPLTFNPGDILTATTLNAQLRDNMSFVMNGKQVATKVFNTTVNTTYATASWGVVDTTNLSIGLTNAFQSGRVFVSFSFGVAISGSTAPLYAELDIQADNGNYLSSGTSTPTEGVWFLSAGASLPATLPIIQYTPMVISGYFTGLTAGVAHTFKLYAKTNATTNTVITIYTKNNHTGSLVTSVLMSAVEV